MGRVCCEAPVDLLGERDSLLWWNCWKCFQGSLGRALGYCTAALASREGRAESHSADRMRDKRLEDGGGGVRGVSRLVGWSGEGRGVGREVAVVVVVVVKTVGL